MSLEKYQLAKTYITYRYTRALVRKANTTDQSIKELIEGESEYWNNENSNKNATVVTTQRDYLAGITSTDITRRFLLPEDIVKAHDEGIIHFHDADYFAQNALTNCELINLEDMLQNGTIMNGVMIEKPHRFITACTIATQIILAVTSSTYGGATISLSHLAPFVKSSYDKYYKKYKDRGLTEKQCEEYAKQDTRKEVSDGVQTFNYQVNSMTNTNGQAPFLSVCMYLGETDEYKEELAMIIEEFLKQRIEGFKNEKGVYVTPAFPKLLYVLEEDNINENSKYWYLTELAAKCTAKRMVPDYISEKKMKELKVDKNGEDATTNRFVTVSFVKTSSFSTYNSNNKGIVTIQVLNYPEFKLNIENLDRRDGTTPVVGTEYSVSSQYTESNNEKVDFTGTKGVITDSQGLGVAHLDKTRDNTIVTYTIKEDIPAVGYQSLGTDINVVVTFDANGYVSNVQLENADTLSKIATANKVSNITDPADNFIVNVQLKNNPILKFNITASDRTNHDVKIKDLGFTIVSKIDEQVYSNSSATNKVNQTETPETSYTDAN